MTRQIKAASSDGIPGLFVDEYGTVSQHSVADIRWAAQQPMNDDWLEVFCDREHARQWKRELGFGWDKWERGWVIPKLELVFMEERQAAQYIRCIDIMRVKYDPAAQQLVKFKSSRIAPIE